MKKQNTIMKFTQSRAKKKSDFVDYEKMLENEEINWEGYFELIKEEYEKEHGRIN